MLDQLFLVLVADGSLNDHALLLLVEHHTSSGLSSDVLVVVEGELMQGLRSGEIEQPITVRQLIGILMRVIHLVVKHILPRDEPHMSIHLQPLPCEDAKRSQGSSDGTKLRDLYKPLHITIKVTYYQGMMFL